MQIHCQQSWCAHHWSRVRVSPKACQSTNNILDADSQPFKQLQHTPDACAYVQIWCFHSPQASVLTQQKVSPLPCLHQISKQDPDRAPARPGAEKRYVLHIHHGSRHQKLHVSWAVIVQCHVKMWHRAIHHCYIMILHVSLSHGLYAAGPCFEHAGLFACTQSHLTSTLRSRWLWDDVFMGSVNVHSLCILLQKQPSHSLHTCILHHMTDASPSNLLCTCKSALLKLKLTLMMHQQLRSAHSMLMLCAT